jgi:dTDP-glucose pyrophosphorylase
MIELAANPYIGAHRIHAVILDQHDQQYEVSRVFREIFGDAVGLVVLPNPTSGPAETIYEALKRLDLGSNDSFLVHDCDSMFTHGDLVPGNVIFVDTLNEHPTLRNPANKSYVGVNDQDMVVSIMEKKIISDLFCVGGYQFASPDSYMRSFESLRDSRAGEIYISTVIDHLISTGELFSTRMVSGFVDLGTVEDWQKCNDRPTIFCDIDGTLIHNQSPYGKDSYANDPVVLRNNADTLLLAQDRGCQIIFTTSRSHKWIAETMKMLDNLGFRDYRLLMDLHHARRVLINDYAPTNPYPCAVAINIRRDDDTLDQLLRFDQKK